MADKFYRAERVPTALLQQLDEAAEGTTRGRAFIALLESVDLQDAVLAGQAAARGWSGQAEEDWGVQVPAALKQQILDLSDRMAVRVGAVGRFVLMARAGRMAEAVKAAVPPAPAAVEVEVPA